jgi:uncharacterized membrane protein
VTDDPLELPATATRVHLMADAIGLPAPARDRALRLATASPAPAEWRRFLSTALALLGAGLALAGVVCFFAYNWSRIGRFGKLGLIEAGIVVAAVVGWRRLPRLSGQIALAAAAVLVGPLLGVIGQTYQTGADPYGLFLTWALVIAPWVVAARFPVLWVVAVAVLDAGLALWWTQVVSGGGDGELAALLLVASVHAAAVAAWEWQRRRPAPWLDGAWAMRAVAATGFGALFAASAAFVVDPDGVRGRLNVPGLVGLVALAAAITAALAYHRRVRPDRFVVTVAVLAGMALVAVAVGRLLVVDLDLDELGLLLVALLVIAEIALGLRWLRGAAPRREREA